MIFIRARLVAVATWSQTLPEDRIWQSFEQVDQHLSTARRCSDAYSAGPIKPPLYPTETGTPGADSHDEDLARSASRHDCSVTPSPLHHVLDWLDLGEGRLRLDRL